MGCSRLVPQIQSSLLNTFPLPLVHNVDHPPFYRTTLKRAWFRPPKSTRCCSSCLRRGLTLRRPGCPDLARSGPPHLCAHRNAAYLLRLQRTRPFFRGCLDRRTPGSLLMAFSRSENNWVARNLRPASLEVPP